MSPNRAIRWIFLGSSACQVAGHAYVSVKSMQHPDLEPAVVDPAKLRRTAWILLGVMATGGILVMLAYQKMAKEQSRDNRPAMVHQIRKERDLRVIRQDGKTVDLFDLRGHVVALHCMSLEDPDRSTRSLRVMQRLKDQAEGMPGLRLVTLALDSPTPLRTVPYLEKGAAVHGMEMPVWWLATTARETLHPFVKNELKTSVFPHTEGGKWQFDTSIILLDREGRIRRAVVPQELGGPPFVATFDFDQAAGWDAQGVKTGTPLSNEKQLEALLLQTIQMLLDEPKNPQ